MLKTMMAKTKEAQKKKKTDRFFFKTVSNGHIDSECLDQPSEK